MQINELIMGLAVHCTKTNSCTSNYEGLIELCTFTCTCTFTRIWNNVQLYIGFIKIKNDINRHSINKKQ